MKQALLKVHAPSPKEICQIRYNVTKSNEQDQFVLFYKPRNFFEGNTYKYISISNDVTSRCEVTRSLSRVIRTLRTLTPIAFEVISEKDSVFNYLKLFK